MNSSAPHQHHHLCTLCVYRAQNNISVFLDYIANICLNIFSSGLGEKIKYLDIYLPNTSTST